MSINLRKILWPKVVVVRMKSLPKRRSVLIDYFPVMYDYILIGENSSEN